MRSVVHVEKGSLQHTASYSVHAKECLVSSVLVLSSLEVEHLSLELLCAGFMSSLFHCWQESAPRSLFPSCAWFPWQPPLKDVCTRMLTLGVVCFSCTNHRGLHTEKSGYLFPVCSDFTDNKLADVFQFGVWVNADCGVGIWGGWDQSAQNKCNESQPTLTWHWCS